MIPAISCGNSLQFIAIHGSVGTDRTEIYTPVYRLVANFSNLRKITDCIEYL